MKKLFKKQLKKGFTLVEVLITMTIVGIISTVALVSYKDMAVFPKLNLVPNSI